MAIVEAQLKAPANRSPPSQKLLLSQNSQSWLTKKLEVTYQIVKEQIGSPAASTQQR
jgi:hypothetical protein